MSSNSHKTSFRRDRHAHFPFGTFGSAFSPTRGGVRGGALYPFLKGVFAFLPRVDYYLFEDYPWPLASLHKSSLLKLRTALVIYLRPFITACCYGRICYAIRPSRHDLIYGYRFSPRDLRIEIEGNQTRSKENANNH